MRRLALMLTLVLSVALGAVPALAEDWHYTVRPGDDLWTLAARYCGSASFAPRIAAENGLADQSLIRPGMRLKVPVAWLVRQPVTAEVVAVRGTVLLLEPAPQPARVGDPIAMGQRLRSEDGSAIVAFADGSTLQLSDNSEVLFNVLTAYGDTGMVDTNLRFYRGRSTSRVQRRNQGSRFRISTPSGTAAVRGTEFRVGIDAATTLTESLEGEVGFRQDQEIALPAGIGLAASPDALVREPLLEAPRWIAPGGPVALGQVLPWQPVAGARGYRVSVFAAADPHNPLREQLSSDTNVVLRGLQLGRHTVAVRAVSDSGLEGYDGRLDVEVRAPAPDLRNLAEVVRGATRLEWRPTQPPYTVQIVSAAAFADAEFAAGRDIVVDGAALALPELAPGRYRWRVRDAASVYGEPGAFTVVPGTVTGLAGRTAQRTATLTWTPLANAVGYRVALFDAGAATEPLQVVEVTEPGATIELPAFRRYQVRVSALENGLTGEPAMLELQPQPRAPWWLLAGLFFGLLAL